MKVWIPRTLRDDGMIMVHECYGHHQCLHTYVRVDDHLASLAEKDTEIAELQAMADQLDAVLLENDPEYSTLKSALAEKEREIDTLKQCFKLVDDRRAQLQADLDHVIHEAMWAMEELRERLYVVDEYNRENKPEREREVQIDTFFNNPLVQSWKARQEEVLIDPIRF